MSKTIFCTNPICNAVIEVMDNVDSIVCTSCNTWQLVSMAESAEGSDASPGTDTPAMDAGPLPPPPFLPPAEDAPISSSGNSVIPPNLGYSDLEEDSKPIPASNHGSASRPDANPDEQVGMLQSDGRAPMKLKLGKNTIGRKGTDIVIPEPTISREHCVLEAVKNDQGQIDYFIYDIGHDSGKPSTNGVFISGRSQRLEEFEKIKLYNGSVITVGNVYLVLTT